MEDGHCVVGARNETITCLVGADRCCVVRRQHLRSVTQTREIYEHSKNTLQTVLESWQNSFGTAGQGVTALNRKIIELAERNIDTSFDLAMNLCRAKNLTEVMELQTAYWQKQFGELKNLTDEVRRRSAKTRVGAGVARRT